MNLKNIKKMSNNELKGLLAQSKHENKMKNSFWYRLEIRFFSLLSRFFSLFSTRKINND